MRANALRIIIVLFILCVAGISSLIASDKNAPHSKFKFEHFKSLNKIPEPSDIVYDKETGHYFIVSDHGMLFECDLQGNIIRKAAEEGQDFEGVEVKDSFVYVSDERPRKVYKYRKGDLSLVKTYTVTWGGAANRAFESITYNYSKKCFVLVSQAPVVIIEYDEQFKELDRFPFKGPRDINGARWYKDEMYLLGAKDEVIFRCDPVTYEVRQYCNINVLNPEGLAFDGEGNVTITSDNLQRIYFFKNFPTIKQ